MKNQKGISILLAFSLMAVANPTVADAKNLQLKNVSTKKTMAKGSVFALKTNVKANKLTFSSSKSSVASISADGTITAKKKGTTTITIKKGSQKKKIKLTVGKPVGYTISKTSGTYASPTSVKVKAKKNYVVYYSTGSSFKKTKKIKSSKSKTYTFASTSSLSVYATKKKTKVTKKLLKKAKKTLCDNYQYTITKVNGTNPTATVTPGSTPSGNNTPAPTPTVPSNYAGDDSQTGYVAPSTPAYDAVDQSTSSDGATDITLSATAPENKIETASYSISKKNKLTITAPGVYTISSNSTEAIDGLIEVNLASEGNVQLILKGIHLTSSANTAPTSDTGLITFKNSNLNRAIITVADGTENILSDVGATGIDKDDNTSTTYTAGIVCKKTDLTINGSGTLKITSDAGNGIKCTKDLKILNSSIIIGNSAKAAGHNGITAKTGLFTSNANLDVYATGDAIKTTLSASDVTADSSLAELGNIDIDGGILNINSKAGDGISAYRTLTLNPTSLTANASYSSSSKTDETSSKAIKAGTTIFIPSTAGTINLASTRDDALHCDSHIRIDGGDTTISAGDDGIHSDTGFIMNGGKINVTKSYEGLESADITINSGDITVKSSDDGFNAGGGSDSSSDQGFGPGGFDNFTPKDPSSNSTDYQIIINGGTITVDAEGDGIDSNGNIYIKGGTITVNGPTNGGNGALDYGDGGSCVCEISGGTLIAAGAKGMDVTPTSGSTQAFANIQFSTTQNAGTYVVVKNDAGDTILTAQPTKKFQSVVVSCPDFTVGTTYKVFTGTSLSSLTEATTMTATTTSTSTGGMGGPGGPGNRR